jgi:hypothetical protein
MATILSDSISPRHRVLPEKSGGQAKADLRKADVEDWKPRIGLAIQRAISLCGWSLKEFAGAVGRDPRQCSRWLDGSERVQLDLVFAVEALRQPLAQAFGELAGAEVSTVITIRRTA